MKKRNLFLTICGAALVWFATAAPASACPMCKLARESDSRLPRAYMYSILFMLGMPMSLGTAFGIGFYRLARKGARMQQQAVEQAVVPVPAGEQGEPTEAPKPLGHNEPGFPAAGLAGT